MREVGLYRELSDWAQAFARQSLPHKMPSSGYRRVVCCNGHSEVAGLSFGALVP